MKVVFIASFITFCSVIGFPPDLSNHTVFKTKMLLLLLFWCAHLMFVYKTSEGNNILETLLAGLEGEGRGGGQEEDGDEAEHAEASSDHAVIRSLGAGPFIRGRLIFNWCTKCTFFTIVADVCGNINICCFPDIQEMEKNENSRTYDRSLHAWKASTVSSVIKGIVAWDGCSNYWNLGNA
jgi:hypothetical protein